MWIRNLTTSTKIVKVKAASVSGLSTVTSDTVDMAGFQSVTFITTVGDGSLATLGAVYGDLSNSLSAVSGATVGGATQALVTEVLDLPRLSKRYVAATVTRSNNTTVGEIYAILTGREVPEQNTTPVQAAALFANA
jgi:hypothetical protein